MMMYQVVNDQVIKLVTENLFIPVDHSNRHYQEYLVWIDEGNQPLPPDPIPVVVPQSVTMAQARIALAQAGLLTTIEAGLNALPEPQKTTALTAWEYSPTVSRTGTFVTGLASQFGLTEEDLDNLFIAAAAIQL
jgi:hypothetical protein